VNSEWLLDGFNLLGDEPETIQQFRKLVVGLAVSGKLVARDEKIVEPASLLKLIEAKKLVLFQQGDLRKQNPLPSVAVEDLPKGFRRPTDFVRLATVARIEKGLTGIAKAEPGPYPLVVTAAGRASCDHFDFDGAAAIVPLVSSAGHGKASLQRLHYQEGKFALGSILAGIFPYAPEFMSARFLFEYLTAFKDELIVSRMIGTANVSLNIGKVSDLPVPLVSPSVQQKVDDLMALCDRLVTARAERESKRDRLTAASLARLNAPDPETFAADAHFALDALATLTARRDQIKELRQTILNLAVRGKLVPQDPKAEPASELLKRIAKEKERLVKEGKTKRQDPLPEPDFDQAPFELPVSWLGRDSPNLASSAEGSPSTALVMIQHYSMGDASYDSDRRRRPIPRID
jgi:type I restriction enzyme S subunit